jgi:hypothetical protein
MSIPPGLFEGLEDPRSSKNQVYPFEYMMLVTLCACMAGETSFTGIADYAELTQSFFKGHFALPAHTPHHDTFRYLLDSLDPEVFYPWFEALTSKILLILEKRCEGEDLKQVAIDGKTIRNSGTSRPFHRLSAWCTHHRLVLGCQTVEAQTNEITAIPLLLSTLDLKGRVVTLDAMGGSAGDLPTHY